MEEQQFCAACEKQARGFGADPFCVLRAGLGEVHDAMATEVCRTGADATSFDMKAQMTELLHAKEFTVSWAVDAFQRRWPMTAAQIRNGSFDQVIAGVNHRLETSCDPCPNVALTRFLQVLDGIRTA